MAKISFIGGGNMATCIFNGIISNEHRTEQDEIIVSGPHLDKLGHFAEQGAKLTTNNVEAFNSSDIIFLGVKPQVMGDVLAELKNANVSLDGKLLISMAAGWRIESFYKHLGSCHLIRIMPSTPAQLGLGVTSVCCGDSVTEEERECCLDLLFGLGMTVLTNEEGINSLGALAGSAPAFLYRFMEALVSETMKRGFTKEQARAIIEQVALGTANMVINNSDKTIAQLREAVTSKGGTTFQGLNQMTEYRFEDMMASVIDACLKRTHEFEEMYR